MTERNIWTVTQEYLLKHYDYDSISGNLIWKIPTVSWIKQGDIVGCMRRDGYRVTRIKGKNYLVHRLIFLFHHGYLPDLIDHKDQDSTNNRIENLRASNKTKNSYNSGLPSNNKSGVRGVSWDKKNNKWIVRFKSNGVYKFLGYFVDLEEAKFVREQEEKGGVCYE